MPIGPLLICKLTVLQISNQDKIADITELRLSTPHVLQTNCTHTSHFRNRLLTRHAQEADMRVSLFHPFVLPARGQEEVRLPASLTTTISNVVLVICHFLCRTSTQPPRSFNPHTPAHAHTQIDTPQRHT